MVNEKLMKILKDFQVREITEKYIYIRIAKYIKNDKNRETLLRIAREEEKHYNIWKKYSKVDMPPSKFLIFFYTLIARLFGYTLPLSTWRRSSMILLPTQRLRILMQEIPEAIAIFEDELEHERSLIDMLDEDRLQYIGSMVLGLNDALVEFTGSLAGYTFAMQSTRLITLAGIITGISATLSMGASEYLSARSDGEKHPLRSATYTGVAYLITVIILILPYLLLPDQMYSLALGLMLLSAIAIIAAFNYYIAVAKDSPLKSDSERWPA